MMIGNNDLYLNEATVKAALEMYLNDAIVGADKQMTVMAVSETSMTPRTFRVRVMNPEPKETK